MSIDWRDGNIFNLMGIASKTLKSNNMEELAKEMCNKVTTQAKSYDQALSILGEYVDTTSKENIEEDFLNDILRHYHK